MSSSWKNEGAALAAAFAVATVLLAACSSGEGPTLSSRKEVGVTDSEFESCVREQKHVAAHQEYTEKTMAARGLSGTPTIMVDGKPLDTNTVFVPSALRDAIVNAAKG